MRCSPSFQKSIFLFEGSRPSPASPSNSTLEMEHWWNDTDRVAQLVEALHLKLQGHGFVPDGGIGTFHSLNPSGRTIALGSTQPLTEMSTRDISWWVKAAGA